MFYLFFLFAPSPCFLPCLRASTCGYFGTSRTVSLGTCFILIFHVNIVYAIGTFSFGHRHVSGDIHKGGGGGGGGGRGGCP